MTDQHRGSAASRGYGHRWQKARLEHLQANPLCVKCKAQRRTTAAKVVDHVTPHRGDQKLFWDRKNWQSLCTPCHSSTKQREERGGNVIGCDADGLPLDPAHPWAVTRRGVS